MRDSLLCFSPALYLESESKSQEEEDNITQNYPSVHAVPVHSEVDHYKQGKLCLSSVPETELQNAASLSINMN